VHAVAVLGGIGVEAGRPSDSPGSIAARNERGADRGAEPA
jgi:hypothetical protein